jgi:diadenosine tetraphosphatase ApaH/serine/threonine PP2A family protein phosphatase
MSSEAREAGDRNISAHGRLEDSAVRYADLIQVFRRFPAIKVVSKLRMCDLKKDLNAEDAEVFAKARREKPRFAYLCALCV